MGRLGELRECLRLRFRSSHFDPNSAIRPFCVRLVFVPGQFSMGESHEQSGR